jgi:rhodanese-related sulfurtransferase/CBS domain-containing protein
MMRDGVQLLDVLPRKEYDEFHLPGAMHSPLTELRPQRAAKLDANKPTVVYCYDLECDLSPRAAALLVAFGFTDVFDYAAGKLDWAAHGLPIEGEWASKTKICDVAERDMPTCGIETPVYEAWKRANASGWDICVVVDSERVVLGLVEGPSLEADGRKVSEVMTPGPSTYRPYIFASDAAEFVEEQRMERVMVTDSDGKLLGVVKREDVMKHRDGDGASKGGGRYRSAAA